MRMIELENSVRIEDVYDFNIKHILECGQCFRWSAAPDGSYLLIAMDRIIRIRSSEAQHMVWIENTTPDEVQQIWAPYFDLLTDYGEIKKTLCQDAVLKKAIPFGSGIRILRQDLWETILSFIISANNNIPRIKQIIHALCVAYGRPIPFEGRLYYAFPTKDRLTACVRSDYDCCRAGFRGRYLYETVRILGEGAVDLERLGQLETAEAKRELMKLMGVGSKVADCILLFALHRTEVYPVDVWVKKVTEDFYLKRETSLAGITQFAKDKFGSLAGYAQQYLFYYGRETKFDQKVNEGQE